MKEEKARNKKRNWYNTDKDWRERFCRRGCAVILGVKKREREIGLGQFGFYELNRIRFPDLNLKEVHTPY